jgi:hypothetical protein
LGTSNIIRACTAIESCVLALEVDHVAFHKALFPLVKESKLENTQSKGYNLNINSPPKKIINKKLDCE